MFPAVTVSASVSCGVLLLAGSLLAVLVKGRTPATRRTLRVILKVLTVLLLLAGIGALIGSFIYSTIRDPSETIPVLIGTLIGGALPFLFFLREYVRGGQRTRELFIGFVALVLAIGGISGLVSWVDNAEARQARAAFFAQVVPRLDQAGLIKNGYHISIGESRRMFEQKNKQQIIWVNSQSTFSAAGFKRKETCLLYSYKNGAWEFVCGREVELDDVRYRWRIENEIMQSKTGEITSEPQKYIQIIWIPQAG